MNKADLIRLNQRWIRETEEKIKALDTKIAVYMKDINGCQRVISELEGEEE